MSECVANESSSAGTPVYAGGKRFPRSVFCIIGTEACERFSYYGMRGILTLYIAQGLLGDLAKTDARAANDAATTVGHLFTMGVYFMPLLGAWIADKFWGRYWTIIVMSLFYIVGNAILALTVGSTFGLALGLSLLAFGSGGIKPCVSAFMGEQFAPDQRDFIARAFGMFYWAINFGSFFAFGLIPIVKDNFGYAWAFGVPGIVMALSTLIFVAGTRHYKITTGEWIRVPAGIAAKRALSSAVLYGAIPGWIFCALMTTVSPEMLGKKIVALSAWEKTGFVALVGVVAFFAVAILFLIAAFLPKFLSRLAEMSRGNAENTENADAVVSAKKSVPVEASMTLGERFCAIRGLLLLFAVIPVFWALFDQMLTTWVLLGAQMSQTSVLSYPVTAETMQNANSIFVMLLIPIFSFTLYPLLNSTKLFKATPLRRMTVGMFLAAASFVICGFLQNSVDASAATGTSSISVWWMALPYFVLTAGEVLFSATGLEFAFSQAPTSMRSTIASLWNLTTMLGNFLVVLVVALARDYSASDRFYFFAALMFTVAVIFGVFSLFYKYRDVPADAIA